LSWTATALRVPAFPGSENPYRTYAFDWRSAFGSRKQKPRSQGVVCERGKLPTPGVWLEVDLAPELEDSGVKGRGDLAETAVAEVGIHGIELGVVPRVEGF
jgi:hypothetical protein